MAGELPRAWQSGWKQGRTHAAKSGTFCGKETGAMSLAIAGRVVSEGMQGNSRQGGVRAGGVARKASLDLVPEARVGEYVLLRMDVAIQRIDNKQAARMEEALGRIGRLG